MSILSLTAGKQIPHDVNAVIEIPANDSRGIKYEVDKATGLLMVDRFMPTAMYYPCNYGFVPSTLAGDGDPADILVVTPFPVQAGCLMRVRALGMLTMQDEGGEDNKILALPIVKTCVQLAHWQQLSDIPSIFLDSLVHFFEHYKALEPGKWVKVQGWSGVDAATQELNDSIQRYQQESV